VAEEGILELYRREVTPELYAEIRELYKKHSMAEDARDLPGLISTLTPDCVYELVQTGHRWEGHEGAARFYTQLLTAFPDIRFDLTDIVIGPQGVCEEARVSATHEAPWLGVEPTGERLEWTVVIWFPWDRDRRLFRGERVYVSGIEIPQAAAAASTTPSSRSRVAAGARQSAASSASQSGS
jgi:SnoaL-like polyketide cyclase